MNNYVAYVRVSTLEQQSAGTSLVEQRRAIECFALRNDLVISCWYEEVASAARASGRPKFDQAVQALRLGDAAGLIIHKIDRGARNLHDWALIGELIDEGIDVRFAHDDLRLNSRSGRLAADIQAVIAADYIRNLREETRKGIQGRLKQGLYPWPAPMGYIDCGGGRTKRPHPAYGRLIAEAFRLYASGRFSLRTLRDEMLARGLRNRGRRRLTKNDLWRMLRNPFYAGVIELRVGARYEGAHQPLIPAALFDDVQRVLSSRQQAPCKRMAFRYSRRIKHRCGQSLVGELQKAHVYYRCHSCVRTCLREDWLDRLLAQEVRVSCGVVQKLPSTNDKTALI